MGVRLLPVVIKLDGEFIKAMLDLKDYFAASKTAAGDDDEEDERVHKYPLILFLSLYLLC